MNCQPCIANDHDNCTPRIGAVSLGMQDECLCWRYGEVHFVPAEPLQRRKQKYEGWTADEIRDYEHELGISPTDERFDRDRYAQERDEQEEEMSWTPPMV